MIAGQQQIETGAAAHGTEVNHLVLPVGLVAQVGGGQMLHGVDLGGVHNGLIVGLGQPQIEGGDGLCTYLILPGNVNARLQFDVIDGETGNFLHNNSSCVENGSILAAVGCVDGKHQQQRGDFIRGIGIV